MFSDKKIALCWCVFDKFKSYKETRRVPKLDKQIQDLSYEIKFLRHKISKNKDSQNKDIFYAKLQEAKYRKTVLLQELNEYITKSSIWQTQSFDKLEYSNLKKN